ncbi:hypothetical protein ABB37_08442 [Leptomonas pyrrhocoris]|uniref:Uncharacterized protein n=1 Tax=Leptomonas pyrrhocoris TaxID=157538 RepID=A0A0M9FTH9_LEPPY|nr:hypothetical protein ABB37_08442 [Leptomonas pyrrhocoris]KPA75556.1 hypothetical protein ABB37_08442 [Leptomonas pyrrhocoris]|eukprot:XP_015653995.1 hypothetical protein ABB37_08442 [Leptomonas pyrrhocoris]
MSTFTATEPICPSMHSPSRGKRQRERRSSCSSSSNSQDDRRQDTSLMAQNDVAHSRQRTSRRRSDKRDPPCHVSLPYRPSPTAEAVPHLTEPTIVDSHLRKVHTEGEGGSACPRWSPKHPPEAVPSSPSSSPSASKNVRPSPSLPAPPSTSTAARGAATEGIAESLVRLLRLYLTPPTTPAQPSAGEANRGEYHHHDYDSNGGWADEERASAGSRRGGSAHSAPPLTPLLITGASESARQQWRRLLPSQWVSPEAAPTTAASQGPSAGAYADSARSPADSTCGCHEERQRQLWFLLTRYPRDASTCLSLSLSLCHILEVMRASPPPPLSSSDFQKYIGTSANTAVSRAQAGIVSPVATCLCGCLVRGRYLDPALYRFHLDYYLFHQPLDGRGGHVDVAPRGMDVAHAGESCRCAGVVGGGDHRGGHGQATPTATSPSASIQNRPPPPSLDTQRHPHVACPLLPRQLSTSPQTSHTPSLTSLRMSLQVELMPLLAIQTLASFVWRSSEHECSFRLRQRARAAQRASDGRERESKPHKREHEARGTHTHDGERRSSDLFSNCTTSSCCSISPARYTAAAGAITAFEKAYRSFCDEKNRVWAVMASVRLAWSHLQQRRSVVLFIPHLEVLGAAQRDGQQKHTQPEPPRLSTCSCVSELARAAAAVEMTPEALADELKRCMATPGGATPSCAYIDAFHRLRVGLLAQVVDRCPVPSHYARAPVEEAATSPSMASGNATQELLRMESYVLMELEGRTAQMPLWCEVALDVLLLFSESRRRDRALRRCTLDSIDDSVVQCETRWDRMCCCGVRRLVRLLLRLLLLPTLRAGAKAQRSDGTALRQSKSGRSVSSPRPPSSAAATGNHRSGERCTACVSDERPSMHRSTATADGVLLSGEVALTDALTALSQHMLHHPLFGVAAAVVSGAVPLSWAATCVTGSSSLLSFPSGCTPKGSASTSRDALVWRELARLAEDIPRWLAAAQEQV